MQDRFDFKVKNMSREPVGGYPIAQLSAQFRLGLKYGCLMSHLSQIVCHRKTGRSASHYGNPVARRFRETKNQLFVVLAFIISEEAL